MLSLWGEPVAKAKAKVKYIAKKHQKPVHEMTHSGFSASLHNMLRRKNGGLEILDDCPDDFVMLPAFLESKTPAEVAAGFKACICHTLAGELEARDLLHKQEARGLIANLLRCLSISQDKLIQIGCEMAWKAGVPQVDLSDTRVRPERRKGATRKQTPPEQVVAHSLKMMPNEKTGKDHMAVVSELHGMTIVYFLNGTEASDQKWINYVKRINRNKLLSRLTSKRGAA